MKNNQKETIASWGSLLVSSTTLVCCTLPLVLIALGFGTVLSALMGHLPWLARVSRYQFWIFIFSAGLLFSAYLFIYNPNKTCPTDPVLRAKCDKLTRINKIIFWIAAALWSVGFFSAYLALPISLWLNPTS